MRLSSVSSLLICLAFSFVSVSAQETIKWVSFEKAVELAQKEPRPIIMDVFTDWCGWCKKMDATTFANPKIAAYVNQYFYAVKFNAEQKEAIKFRDREYKFIPNGQRGYHELAAELMQGKLSYPTIVYLDKDINLIQPIPGFQTPEALEPIINFFGSDKYRSMSWEDFSSQFKSNL
jgi:thioredoxin-related protein